MSYLFDRRSFVSPSQDQNHPLCLSLRTRVFANGPSWRRGLVKYPCHSKGLCQRLWRQRHSYAFAHQAAHRGSNAVGVHSIPLFYRIYLVRTRSLLRCSCIPLDSCFTVEQPVYNIHKEFALSRLAKVLRPGILVNVEARLNVRHFSVRNVHPNSVRLYCISQNPLLTRPHNLDLPDRCHPYQSISRGPKTI